VHDNEIHVDQRKQLEQRLDELAHTEQRLRSVVEHVLDGIITIDDQGTILTFNRAAEAIFGYAADEVLGQNVRMLMPDPYRREHDQFLANYRRTGQARIIGIGRETLACRKDGSIFPIELGVSEFGLDGRRYFTGIVRDITERERAENVARFIADASRSLAELVDFQSTLQKIARLAVPFFADWCMIHMANEQGVLTQLAVSHVDPAKVALAEKLSGHGVLRANDSAGVGRVFRTGRAEMAAEIPDSLLRLIARDEKHLLTLRQLGVNSYIGVPLRVRERVLGVISFLVSESRRQYDATDLQVAQDLAHRAGIAIENARLYAELREADRRKDDFLAILAHELRNPLALLRSGLDLLNMAGTEQDTVQVMQRQVTLLGRLVDDLLDVSRIVRGKVQLKRERIELNSLLQQTVETARPSVDAQRHTLTVSLPPTPVFVDGDPLRLTQIVTNLLNNAVKYTEKGGRIWLSAQREGDRLVLEVRDNGIGISKDLMPRIFDLFTQADRSLERSQGGMGIGLTLVRNLVEMHGGSVTAHSDGEGKGSRFVILLPVAAEEGHQASAPAGSAPPPHRRILVVDDMVASAKLLTRLLVKLGDHEVRTAHDGLSALEAAVAFRPEIMLLDIGLPRMDGYELAKRLREQAIFDDTLLVALTGYGSEADRRRSLEAGFDLHLVKPPSIASLREVLSHVKLAAGENGSRQ
jgi:PAS domain S-box-containing protein